jgi:hypothetical protein
MEDDADVVLDLGAVGEVRGTTEGARGTADSTELLADYIVAMARDEGGFAARGTVTGDLILRAGTAAADVQAQSETDNGVLDDDEGPLFDSKLHLGASCAGVRP